MQTTYLLTYVSLYESDFIVCVILLLHATLLIYVIFWVILT